MPFDGETAIQTFYTLQENTPVQPTLLLPDKQLWDCCGDMKLKVLADDSGINEQNDFFSFMDVCAPTASDAVYKIYKDGTLKATMSGNNNHGVDYAFGFQSVNNQKYVGYKVEWYKVLALYGDGIYKIELVVTDAILGNSSIFSFDFKLCTYRPDRADGTIRLQWYLNGIIGSTYDDRKSINYLSLNWVNQIRLPGFFGYPTAEYVKEEIQYTTGAREWTFDEQEPIYLLKTKPIPAPIHTIFRIMVMQSDRCLITDYNVRNSEKFVNKEIMFQTEYKPIWKPLMSKLAPVELLVRQRYNNYKKHRN